MLNNQADFRKQGSELVFEHLSNVLRQHQLRSRVSFRILVPWEELCQIRQHSAESYKVRRPD